jgi:hypothetical protein
VWIKGYVHHRALGLGMCRHPAFEILEGTVYIQFTAAVIEDLVGVKKFPFLLVKFLTVVVQRSVKAVA